MSRQIVLVVEDDTAIRRGLVDALAYAGFHALEAADGAAACRLAIESTLDLVLLDVLLPKRNGFEVLEEIRKSRPQLPVIMLTARGAEEDRIRGLRAGADDYVVKPFSAREVLARIEAVLRRSAERPGDVQSIRFHSLTIDLQRREVRQGASDRQPLSERECAILRHLAANRDRAIDRNELLHCVWGLDPRGIETRAVDMQIRRLREKLEGASGSAGDENGDDSNHSLIQTVRAKGYMLHAEAEVAGT